MAAIVFDTLGVARRLEEAGMSAQLAEAQAEIMAESFVHNTEALVTRDYLDARLDARLGGLEARIDGRFNLVYWMQALIIASTVIPALSKLLL